MQTCRSDGVVLKPSRPVTRIDACFRDQKGALQKFDPTCHQYSTYTDFDKQTRVHYFFSNSADPLSADMLPTTSTDHVVYNFYTGEVLSLPTSANVSLAPGYEGHAYVVVSPVLGTTQNKVAFVGEVDKYTTASGKRFANLKAGDGSVTVDVTGVPKEEVKVCIAAEASNWALKCSSVSFSACSAHECTQTVTVS